MIPANRLFSVLAFSLALAIPGLALADQRGDRDDGHATRHQHAAGRAYPYRTDNSRGNAPWCPTHSTHHNHSYGYYGFNGGYYGVHDGSSYEEVFSRAYDNGYSDGYNAIAEESGGTKPYRRGYAQGYRDGRRDSRNHNRNSAAR